MSASDSQQTLRMRRVSLLLFAIIILIALALRLHAAHTYEFNLDEQWHLALTVGLGSPFETMPPNQLVLQTSPVTASSDRAAPASIWSHMTGVLHPPLYVIILRFWCDCFGYTESSARALSILCGLLTITCVFLAVQSHASSTVALWTSLILAVSPTLIHTHTMVRSYSMLTLFAAVTLLVVTRSSARNVTHGRALFALSLLLLAMMLTHYFAIGACAALALIVFIRLRPRDRMKWSVMISCVAVLYCICWGPFAVRQMRDVSWAADGWVSVDAKSNGFFDVALQAANSIARLPFNLVAAIRSDQQPSAAMSIVILPLALLALRQNKDLWIWLTFTIGTIGFVFFLDLIRSTQHLSYVRYTVLAAPAVVAVICITASASGRIVTHVLPASLVLLSVLHFDRPIPTEAPRYEQAGAIIAAQTKPGDVLLVEFIEPAIPWKGGGAMLEASHIGALTGRYIAIIDRPISDDLQRQLNHRRVFLLRSRKDVSNHPQNVPGFRVVRNSGTLFGESIDELKSESIRLNNDRPVVD